jgi:alpha-L-rhamnosidase
MFEGSRFIKSGAVNDASGKTYAPMFRRLFSVGQPVSSARLVISGLGYVYAYLNGEKISEDLFTAPVSDYRKTLWYNEYDVTPLLRTGMNVFAAVCGNGWYNEVIPSSWDFDKSPWNDTPKLIMQLYVDRILVLETDEKFKVTVDTPYLFNQLRSGEHFDARKYDENWNTLSYDDSEWDKARYDNNAPQGVFRKCECEPIRECREYPALSVQTAANEGERVERSQDHIRRPVFLHTYPRRETETGRLW